MSSHTLLPLKKVTLKSSLFCLDIEQVHVNCKHWIVPLTEGSASKMPAMLKKFISKEAQKSSLDVANLKVYLAARPYSCDILLSNSKFAGSRKTCNRLVILHKVSKMYFSNQMYISTISSAIIIKVWSTLGSK